MVSTLEESFTRGYPHLASDYRPAEQGYGDSWVCVWSETNGIAKIFQKVPGSKKGGKTANIPKRFAVSSKTNNAFSFLRLSRDMSWGEATLSVSVCVAFVLSFSPFAVTCRHGANIG